MEQQMSDLNQAWKDMNEEKVRLQTIKSFESFVDLRIFNPF